MYFVNFSFCGGFFTVSVTIIMFGILSCITGEIKMKLNFHTVQ